jgi:glycerol-3-phosphate acyltransferase PlsY
VLRLVAAAGAGYLVGTIPSADVAARLAARAGGGRPPVDLRAAGSGNPGAANAIALLGKGWGYGVLVADVGKGAVASAAGRAIAGDGGAHMGGTAAVVGHCFPVWKRFRGGRGAATSSGQCLATFPVYFPVDLAVAIAVAMWRRRALPATAVASALWVTAAVVWWRRGWPNAWGPKPTAGLPLAAAATSAIILGRFRSQRWAMR